LSVLVLIAWQFLFPPPERKVPERVEQTQSEATPTTTAKEQPPAEKPVKTEDATVPRAREISKAQLGSADLEPIEKVEAHDVVIETDLYRCIMSTSGGGIKKFELNKFRVEPNPKSAPVEMAGGLIPGAMLPLTMDLDIGGKLLPPSAVFSTKTTDLDLSSESTPAKGVIKMSITTRAGLEVIRKYTFNRGSYKIDFEMEVRESPAATEEVLSQTVPVEMTVHWNTPVAVSKAKSRFTFYGIVAHVGEKYVSKRVPDVRKKGPFRFNSADWAGFADGYFLSVLVPQDSVIREVIAGIEGPEGKEVVAEELVLSAGEIQPGKPYRRRMTLYIGPKDHQRLLSMGKDLEAAVGYGRLKAIVVPLLWVLRLFNRLVDNWGLSIILLTVFVKILFFPLTHKSFQQMKAMQALQPRIKEIQQKYKDDREKMNTEMMALYRAHKVNPVGGCLPMLLQLPVLYALYRALYVGLELRHAPFIWWINDLSTPERLFTLPIMGGVSIGFMPLLMGASMYVQQKMTPTATADPMQAKMFMAMPVIFTFMSFGFPSGLVLYWFVSNLLTIIQQYVINRRGT